MKKLAVLLTIFGVLGVLISAAVFYTSITGEYSMSAFVVSEGETLVMPCAPRRATDWAVRLSRNTLHGFWSAPNGLKIDLNNADTGFSTAIEAAAARPASWDDTIIYKRSDYDNIEIFGRFACADLETQTLNGRLNGEIKFPEIKKDLPTDTPSHFSISSQNIDIPVQLEVLNESDFDAVVSSRWWSTKGRVWLIFGVSVAALAIGMKIKF